MLSYKPSFLLPLTLLLVLLPGLARADLHWDKTQVEFTAAPGDTHVTAEFPFVNDGKAPVTLDAIAGSCTCTVVKLDQLTYGPGEHGKITAVFSIDDRVGKHSTTVTVQTRDAKTPPMVLRLVVTVPELVHVMPRLVFWRQGEEANGKTIKITFPAPDDKPVHITGVQSSNPQIHAKLEEVQPGKEYQLTLTPEDTDAATNGQVTLATDSSLPRLKEIVVLSRVFGRIPGLEPTGYRALPPTVQWKLGASADSRTVVLELAQKDPLEVESVDVSSQDFQAELKTQEEGKRYLVLIHPTDTDKPHRAVVRVRTRTQATATAPGKSTSFESPTAAATTQPAERPLLIFVNVADVVERTAPATQPQAHSSAPPASLQGK